MVEKCKVLIADDDETLCSMYKDRLEASGFEVETAEDGEEAIEKVKEIGPSMILLDIMMPKINGYEVFKKLRLEEEIKTPIVFLTALIKDEKKLEELEKETGEQIQYVHKSEVMPGKVVKIIENKLSD